MLRVEKIGQQVQVAIEMLDSLQELNFVWCSQNQFLWFGIFMVPYDANNTAEPVAGGRVVASPWAERYVRWAGAALKHFWEWKEKPISQKKMNFQKKQNLQEKAGCLINLTQE